MRAPDFCVMEQKLSGQQFANLNITTTHTHTHTALRFSLRARCYYNTQYRFSKHDQIGEVKIPLNTIDLAQTIDEWRPLTEVKADSEQVSGRGKSASERANKRVQQQQALVVPAA